MEISVAEIAWNSVRRLPTEDLRELLEFSPGPGEIHILGNSREGRPLVGMRAGNGPLRISLIAGAHADEPAGTRTLLALCQWLRSSPGAAGALKLSTFFICPQANPDGAARNAAWSCRPDYTVEEYLSRAIRELPGDDLEYGFSGGGKRAGRPENQAVQEFLASGGTFHFHASLHGMGFSEGAWFLLNRENVGRTKALREDLLEIVRQLGVPLHDWDRQGEKGFHRIAPGFATTPTSTAMKKHFENLGESGEAEKFLFSSMEYVASLGGKPLQMVSEMPLFLVAPSTSSAPRWGHNFLEVKEALPSVREALCRGDPEPLKALKERFGLKTFPQKTAAQLQLAMIFLGSGLAKLEELSL